MTDDRTPESAESGQDEQFSYEESVYETPASDLPIDQAMVESTPILDADSTASAAFEAYEHDTVDAEAADHVELAVPPVPMDRDAADGGAIPPSRPTLGDRIKVFLGIETDTSARMYSLTHAINIAPEAAVNYVLRGELYLERGQYNLAAEDFFAAVSLAEADLQRDDRSLGLLAQSIQDRALTGYEKAIRRGENGYNRRKSKVD